MAAAQVTSGSTSRLVRCIRPSGRHSGPRRADFAGAMVGASPRVGPWIGLRNEAPKKGQTAMRQSYQPVPLETADAGADATARTGSRFDAERASSAGHSSRELVPAAVSKCPTNARICRGEGVQSRRWTSSPVAVESLSPRGPSKVRRASWTCTESSPNPENPERPLDPHAGPAPARRLTASRRSSSSLTDQTTTEGWAPPLRVKTTRCALRWVS